MGDAVHAAIYCRISQDTAGEALGVARQEKDCRSLCERLGWPVERVFIDNDVSAFSGRQRPAYRALLEAISEGRVNALVCWDPDRLHRSPVELEHFIGLVEEHGTRIAMVMAGGYDLQTANGRMVARMLGAAARHESEHKAERQRSKMAEVAAAGGAHGGGFRPFGYETNSGPLRDDEAALVREAARRLLAGDGVRTVCADWHARGVVSSSGKPWSPTSLKRMLRSARIAGLREHHGEIVAEAAWPPILERDTWEQVRALLNDPSRNRGAYRARVYLLAGFVKCGKCDGPMYARKTRQTVAYFCTDRFCTRISVAALDELVSLQARAVLASAEFAQRVNTQATPDDENLAGRIARIEAELAQWDADKALVGRARWLAATQRLEGERKALRKRYDSLARTSPVAAFAGSWISDGDWAGLGLDRQRTILGELVEKVKVAPVGRVGRFDESRVEVIWRV